MQYTNLLIFIDIFIYLRIALGYLIFTILKIQVIKLEFLCIAAYI